MDQEILTGIIVLGVMVICIIALVVILIRKIITKIKGDIPNKNTGAKIKKKEKTVKEKRKAKNKNNSFEHLGNGNGTVVEDDVRLVVENEEDDNNETILMVVAPKAIKVQLIADTTGMIFETECTDQILIGRKEACDIRITGDKAVSGNHCMLKKVNEDSIVVVDLNSSNGTYLNDSKVLREEYLADGDTLEIGRTRYTVRIC